VTLPGTVPAGAVMARCAESPHYRRAIESSYPEYAVDVEKRARLIRLRGDLSLRAERIPPSPAADADDWEGWLDRVAQIKLREWLRGEQLKTIGEEIGATEAAISGCAANPDALIRSFAADLLPVWSAIKAVVARLRGCHTAAAIVASGDPEVLGAYQELKPLAVELEDIYKQFDIVTAGDALYMHAKSDYLYESERGDDWASEARIRNIDSIFRAWKQPAADIALMRWDQPDPRKYPKDPVERVVWLVVVDAEPWMPTRQELRDLRNQKIRERAHPLGEPPQPQPERQVLNQPPRPPDSSRITPALERIDPPPELAQLANEVVDLDDPVQVGGEHE
jgi:hypothetical protein